MNEQFRVDFVPSPAGPVIEVYSKPHHDLLFKASRKGLFFRCKRCRTPARTDERLLEHRLHWSVYNHTVLAGEPPYRVLCTALGVWLVQADEQIPFHLTSGRLPAYSIYTITSGDVELITDIAAYINNQQS